MRIGELAKEVGVTPDTIRYYERAGLLRPPARTPAGYRDYGEAALDDLRFIKKGKSLGLRLTDLREVMEITSGGTLPCDHMRVIIVARLKEVDEKIRELRELRFTLMKTAARLDTDTELVASCRCAIIESA
jgi:DNA-binding transcriptional MerR regulator